MALLGQVEARSLRGRLIHATIFLGLLMGGATMIYPFLIMVSGSVRSEVDQADVGLIPAYLTDDTALYRKFLERKYNQDIEAYNRAHRQTVFSFKDAKPPTAPKSATSSQLREYLNDPSLPDHWHMLGGINAVRDVPINLRRLRGHLKDEFNGDLRALSDAAATPFTSWQSITLPKIDSLSQRFDLPPGPLAEGYTLLLHKAEPAERQLVNLSGHFLQTMIYPEFGRTSTEAYNAAHTEPIRSFADFTLPATVPDTDQPELRREWIEYVREELHPAFVVTTGVSQMYYDAFVRDVLGDGRRFDLPNGRSWLRGPAKDAYQQLLASLEPEQLRLIGPEYAFGQLILPAAVADQEYRYVVEHAGSLRWSYFWHNYVNVFDELVMQGRVLFNTVIFCLLAILAALLINPLAAYAMSRFRLAGTYKILLLLMATMAFPPMVTLIPQFILLREMGLLNSYFALVIPLAANGYMIFLLKGFFDSLPNELYEAARIDGASETRMFFQITMALSKPILAVLALGTFTSAYMMFLYPLLVAPDKDMWLISVWLYQYQQRTSSPGVYASIMIASIPTLVIFLFTQRMIMRGIVVPTEK